MKVCASKCYVLYTYKKIIIINGNFVLKYGFDSEVAKKKKKRLYL